MNMGRAYCNLGLAHLALGNLETALECQKYFLGGCSVLKLTVQLECRYVRSEVLAVVTMKITVSWVVMLCSLVNCYQCFTGNVAYIFSSTDLMRAKSGTSILSEPTGAGKLVQDRSPNPPCPYIHTTSFHTVYFSILKMEASSTSEMLVMMLHHFSGDSNLYNVTAAQSFLETIETHYKI
jgi:hypothetical protein